MTEFWTRDVRGLKCPMPIVKAKKEIDAIPVGEVLRVVVTDPGSVRDFQGWVKTDSRYELVKREESTDADGRPVFVHLVRRKA